MADRNEQTMKTIKLNTLMVISLAGLLAAGMFPRLSVAQSGDNESDAQLIAQVTVVRPSHQSTRTLSSSEERVNLDPNESASVALQLGNGSGSVHLLAPNGGSINNQGGKLEFDPARHGRSLNFNFKAGAARGRYTVEISQGKTTQILQFWVGAEPPMGRAGPSLTFTGTY